MWEITPTFTIIIGILSIIILIWGKIWIGHLQDNRDYTLWNLLYRMFRGVILTVYAFMGLLLLDICYRLCFLGIIGFGSYSYIAAPVILCVSLALLYIIGSVFVAPTWKSLITFIVMASVYLFITITSSSFDYLFNAFFIGVGLEAILNLFDLLFSSNNDKKSNDDKKPDDNNKKLMRFILSPPLWDKSQRFKKIINAKTYIIIWAIFSIELIFLFEGLSLLYWL